MKITFTCGPGGPNYPWADPDAENGIGGSEECLILMARALADLGHEVIVYNNCGDKKGRYNGVVYVNHQFSNRMSPCDVLVAWRNWYLLTDPTLPAGKKWLWCHDQPVGCHCPTEQDVADGALKHIDKFVLLNSYHRGLYSWIPDDKVFICPIGINLSDYLEEDVYSVVREPARVLYFSHPNRGLDRLREVWPTVKAAVPEATLASFWWEPEHFRSPNEALGILPMQHLGPREVARETCRAGVFGYPCIFAPEISPATTIKAQRGGCYPVVVMQGGMVDTVKFGLEATQETFAAELIEALGMSINGDLDEVRQEMANWAQDTYNWNIVAMDWALEATR